MTLTDCMYTCVEHIPQQQQFSNIPRFIRPSETKNCVLMRKTKVISVLVDQNDGSDRLHVYVC